MPKPEFDASKPFQVAMGSEKPEFDPSKPFEAAAPAAKQDMSMGESFQHGAEQGATLGFGDEAQGALEALGQVVGIKGLGAARNLDEWGLQTPNGFSGDKFADAYRSTRDREREIAHKAEADHPGMYMTGQIAGGVAIPVGAPATVGKAALTGAAVGGAAGLGSSESSDLLDMAKDTGTGALFGGVAGGVLKKAGDVLGGAKGFAEKKAFKAGGGMLKDYRKAGEEGVHDIGRFMLDNDLVKTGDTFEHIGAKAEKLRQEVGEALGKGYENAKQLMSKLSPEAQAKVEAAGFNPARDKAAILAQAQEELGYSFRSKQALSQLDEYLTGLAEKHGNETLNPQLTNEIKTALDKTAINWERNPLTRDPDAETALKAFRNLLNQKVSDQVGALGEAIGSTDAATNLASLNSKYGMASRVARMAKDRELRESGNRMFGLGDTMWGAAGAGAASHAHAGPIAAAAGMGTAVASKVGRTYGNAAMARGADKFGDFVSQFPRLKTALGKLAPGEVEAFQSRLGSKSVGMTPAKVGELDRDSSTSSQLPQGDHENQKKFIEGN